MKSSQKKKLQLSFGYLTKTLHPTKITVQDWQQNDNWYDWIMTKMEQNGIASTETRKTLYKKFDCKSVAMDYKQFNINVLTFDLWKLLNKKYNLMSKSEFRQFIHQLK